MLSKYDKLLIQRNPFKEYSKPFKPQYNNSKYNQLRIYFQCESEYFKNKIKRHETYTRNHRQNSRSNASHQS
jgi:hypothetical protein